MPHPVRSRRPGSLAARLAVAVVGVLLVAAAPRATAASAEASAAAAPPAPVPAAPVSPAAPVWNPALDGPMRRALSGGCADGLAELKELAASGRDGAGVAAEVVRLCRQLAEKGSAGSATPGAAPPLDRSGRSRLAFGLTLYGVWAGIATDVIANVRNDRLIVLFPLLGMTGGLAGSLYATKTGEITAGQAWAIITGLDYGTYSGLLWSAAVSSNTDRAIVGWALATGVAGGVVGGLVATLHPPQGSVEMVRSGGLWGTAAAFTLALLASSDSASTHAIFTTLAIGMDAGLATGAVLASRFKISRNRMLLIDAGALVGLGFGTGGAWLVDGSHTKRQSLGAGGLVGLGAGLIIAGIATAGMDDDDRDTAMTPVPAVVARDTRGRWRLGSLAVAPVAGPPGSGVAIAGASATVFGGVF